MHEEEKVVLDSSDSDAGLPPPIIPQSGIKKLGLPSLKIGGLGLSTLAGKDGKTAEEASDMKILSD